MADVRRRGTPESYAELTASPGGPDPHELFV